MVKPEAESSLDRDEQENSFKEPEVIPSQEEKKQQSTGNVSFKPPAQTDYNDYADNSWTAKKTTTVRASSKQSEVASRKLTTPSVAAASRKSTAPVQPKPFIIP